MKVVLQTSVTAKKGGEEGEWGASLPLLGFISLSFEQILEALGGREAKSDHFQRRIVPHHSHPIINTTCAAFFSVCLWVPRSDMLKLQRAARRMKGKFLVTHVPIGNKCYENLLVRCFIHALRADVPKRAARKPSRLRLSLKQFSTAAHAPRQVWRLAAAPQSDRCKDVITAYRLRATTLRRETQSPLGPLQP